MERLELSVRAHFRARMSIPDHDGDCRSPHGYRFVVTVTVQVPLPDGDAPWTTDLVEIEAALNETLEPLRGADLIQFLGYPSFEAILMWVVRRLRDRLDGLMRIELEAPPAYSVRWSGEG